MSGGALSRHRVQIWGPHQHPYKHTLSEFAYTNSALPGVNNLEDAMTWMLSVMYPLNQSTVPLNSDLPTGDSAVLFTVGSPGIVTSAVTTYKNLDQIKFVAGAGLPPEIDVNKIYYVQDRVGNDFNISTDSDGVNVVDFSTAGTAPNDLINVPNSYRVVSDDGDGKAASYRWEQREGDVAFTWYKVYDMDWGQDEILSSFMNITSDLYVVSQGKNVKDSGGIDVVGTLAGQHVYGGTTAGTNLTLFANSGDGTGGPSGYVQFGDDVRPTADAIFTLGNLLNRFTELYLSTNAFIDTMTIASGSITDTTGSIDFDNENLSTTGTLSAGDADVTKLSVANGANTIEVDELGISSTNGVIEFGSDEIRGGAGSLVTVDTLDLNDGASSLVLTGMVAPGVSGILSNTEVLFTFNNMGIDDISTAEITGQVIAGSLSVDDIIIDADKISSTAALELESVGTLTLDAPLVDVLVDLNVGGDVDVDGTLLAKNVFIDTSVVTTNAGDLELDSFTDLVKTTNLNPVSDDAKDLGSASFRFKDVYISQNIKDGTNTLEMSELVKFRDASVGAATGDTLFYNSVSGKWEPSTPDTEIDHGSISGLADDDHTMYLKKTGRTGGQTASGGLIATETLKLTSYDGITTGLEIKDLSVDPMVGAAFSTQWDGFDIGSSTKNFRDLYTKGQLIGARAENRAVTTGALVNNEGRMMWHTTQKRAFWDNGGSFVAPIFETGSNQATAGANITVSATNDYVIRLTAATSVAKIQVPPFTSFKSLILANVSGAGITFRNNFGGAGSEKILTGTATDILVPTNSELHLNYDNTDSAWIVVGAHAGVEISLNAHKADVANPHAVTKTQVGLSAVTNDAQLIRAANDFNTFTEKTTPVANDVFILEDSAAAGVKKFMKYSNLIAGSPLVAVEYGGTTSTITNAGSTIIKYNTLSEDTHSRYSTSTGLFTADATTAGVYIYYSQFTAALTPSVNAQIEVYGVKNGGTTAIGMDFSQTTGTTCWFEPKVCGLVRLADGDTFGFYSQQQIVAGTFPIFNGATRTFFYMVRIS